MADKKKEPRLDDKRFKLIEDMKLEIWNGYLVGVSGSDIAESMGLSKQTVYRVLRAKKKIKQYPRQFIGGDNTVKTLLRVYGDFLSLFCGCT